MRHFILLLSLFIVTEVASAELFFPGCDKYDTQFLVSLPTAKILMPVGLITLYTSVQDSSHQTSGPTPYLALASGALGVFTAVGYGMGNACNFGFRSSTEALAPGEFNPNDTPLVREEKRKSTLIFVALNTLANVALYFDTTNNDVKNSAAVGFVVPWALLGYYWKDFEKRDGSRVTMGVSSVGEKPILAIGYEF